jgi:hypothetical protein
MHRLGGEDYFAIMGPSCGKDAERIASMQTDESASSKEIMQDRLCLEYARLWILIYWSDSKLEIDHEAILSQICACEEQYRILGKRLG